MLPHVTVTEQDRGLGVVSPTNGNLVVVGASADGDPGVPTVVTSVTELVAQFASGAGVEAAAIPISTYGIPVTFVSTGAAGDKLPEALTALKAIELPYRIALFADAAEADDLGAIETAFTSMRSRNKPRAYIATVRTPTANETNAAYLTALSGLHTSFSTKQGSIGAGAVMQISAVDNTEKLLPFAYAYAAARAKLSPEQNTAALRNGSLPAGTRLRDVNGNPIAGVWDELTSGGLSDVGYAVARSWSGYGGAWVCQELVMSPTGSDITILQRRLVLDIVHEVSYGAAVYRLSVPIRVDRKTGRILEQEALDIEATITSAIKAAVLSTPVMASAVTVVANRMDNILSTGKLGIQVRVIPLGMLTEILIDLGYFNPAIAA